MYKRIFFDLIFGLIILLISFKCTILNPSENTERAYFIPPAEREFRAAWIATVANINWPSQPGLSAAAQKEEAIRLLNLLATHHYNAVILQVRPQADALYESSLEPWSYYLTGRQGHPPEPFYDPLSFWVEEAHRRGLELHVWLNPYRAHHSAGGEVTEASVVKNMPELIVELENGYWWFDPGKEGTLQHSTAVVMDIVKRYNIDGVHFDDYFYPYPSYNNNKDFPDQDTYRAYLDGGGKLSREDWRRNNVNQFIRQLYQKIKKEKPFVKFGLSPFGIWRPNNPPSIAGFDQYEQLYADARLWFNEGWIDYFTPQLYWSINQYTQSFPVLLGWWAGENKKGRHLWPGINIGRKTGEERIDETINQIMITRGVLQEHSGNVHWSIGPLVKDSSLAEALLEGPYRRQALVPSSSWLDRKEPDPPVADFHFRDDSVVINWGHPKRDDVYRWVVYHQYGDQWNYKIMSQEAMSATVPAFDLSYARLPEKNDFSDEELMGALQGVNQLAVTGVDRTGNESKPYILQVSEIPETSTPDFDVLRREIHDRQSAITEEVIHPAVQTGVEVLLEDHLDLIRGKRVGLITNPSAVNNNLVSDVGLLASHPEVDLVALFGAEHGIRGARQGVIFEEGEPDPSTGIPVYSLYGDTYAPKQEWLKDIDIMLFDIQGVGSSWYTFKYSMSFAMEACAKAGISFIVLDRPNPLGGEVVEGPYLELGGIFRHRLPFRHGMTYGELASMWNDREGFKADLKVIKMKGWRRNMMWEDTGLLWIMPSPNMDTYETAVVYPGQCLFERTNISEARGTTKPFLMIGAPWIDGEEAARDLNSRGIAGAIFRPVYFIPGKAGKGENPRHKPWNELCSGVEIMVTNAHAYRSVTTALHILDACRNTNPDSLQWDPPEVIKSIEDPNHTVEDIVSNFQKDINDFMKFRGEYLLYR